MPLPITSLIDRPTICQRLTARTVPESPASEPDGEVEGETAGARTEVGSLDGWLKTMVPSLGGGRRARAAAIGPP